jgi:hypothetical protein
VCRAWMKEGRGEKGEQAVADAFYGGPVAQQRGKAGGPGVGAAWREGSREERGPWARWGTAQTSDIGPRSAGADGDSVARQRRAVGRGRHWRERLTGGTG